MSAAVRWAGTLRGVGGWLVRHWRYTLAVSVLLAAARWVGSGPATGWALAALLVPAVVAGVWATGWPVSYERWVAGPHRRWRWRRWVRRCWAHLARECGLAVRRDGTGPGEHVWVHPRLRRVATRGDTLSLVVRARVGQTVEQLEAAAPALGTAAGAVCWRTRPGAPGVLIVDLVMRDVLTHARDGRVPAGVEVDTLALGRRQDGSPWRLPIRGRHTLVVGCSGAGKGSILWGIAAGLAPAIHADVARLWGVDLKRGVEIGMGAALFTTVASKPEDAVSVLRRLLAVIDARGTVMVGRSRLHEPTPGDPLHVLVVDELAALTAYAEPDVKREANRLLSEILTQGRALGVVVVACVQDPRKDTVGMRGLFTQTIALRLRSAEETRMVLGDGTAALAPAHRVSPTAPGCGWVIDDDGTADRVRADHWPDPLVRDVAARYPAAHLEDLGSVKAAGPQDAPAVPAPRGPQDVSAHPPVHALAAPAPRARKPRSPRTPRTPRAPSGASPSAPAANRANVSSAPESRGWVA